MLVDHQTEELSRGRCNIFEDRYKKVKILGKGNFGEVFLAEELITRRKVAIKVIDTRRFKNEDQKKHAENENIICKRLATDIKHEHIVEVLEVIRDKYCMYLIMEYVGGGELYERIKSQGRLQEDQAKVWFRELIEAVAYIHKHGIVHRDLKPENVLLDDVGGIRLCDFGFGNLFDANKLLDTYCGSPFYAAPEMVTATPYRGPPVDMWSCGVILYAMLTGQLPFHCDTMPELFKKISLGLYREPSTLSEEALSLIRCLLCRNPKRRITAEGVLKHAWLEDRRSSFKKLIKIPTTVSMTFKMPKSSSPSTFDLVALPSPVVSVGDEELASYNNLQPNQKASKATQFLLHAIHRKSQVAPSKEKPKDTSKKGGKALGIVADRIKRLFSNSLVHKRLMPT